MLCLEKGVDYRNVDVDLSIYTYIEKIYGLTLHYINKQQSFDRIAIV